MHRVSSNFVIPAVVMLFIRSQTSRCDIISDCLEYTYDKCDFNKDNQEHLKKSSTSPALTSVSFFAGLLSVNFSYSFLLIKTMSLVKINKHFFVPDLSTTVTSVQDSSMTKG